MEDQSRALPKLIPSLLASILVLASCQSQDPPLGKDHSQDRVTESVASSRYQARIRRSSYGIPHIEAADPASLAFGEGYAQAEDHLCTIADQVIKVRSERSRYFGAGKRDAHLYSDVAMLSLDIYQRAAQDLENSELRQVLEGFAAGYNHYLEQTGVARVPGWCQGADWVRPINANDLAAYHRSFIMLLPQFAEMIATAQPPGPDETATGALQDKIRRNGSNGWALGSNWTETGNAMLIANPHYPWVGAFRFWEKHLVIPGSVNIYGAGLIGMPGVAIGFNAHVGWTHTVSDGQRLTFYVLQLDPDDPTRYIYDGEVREMSARDITVQVRLEDGTLQGSTITTWTSHFGPVLNFSEVGWTPETALSVRDANADNNEAMPQWMAMAKARNIDELQAIHVKFQGMPWVNTIAADSNGSAWYTDSAATPGLSAEALAALPQLNLENPVIAGLAKTGLTALPGNQSMFEWQDSPGARDPGIVPGDRMPQLESRDYVFNANDSFWLANSQSPIEGDYSPLHGPQRTIRSLRTRNNDLTLSKRSPDIPAGDDGLFSRQEMMTALMSNRSYAAELLKPDLLAACRATPSATVDEQIVKLGEACVVLAVWDNRFDSDSRGAVLFREWIGQYPSEVLAGKGILFAGEFDPNDPINTPAGLADPGLALQNLARATLLLQSAGHALDVPLGDLQYAISKLPHRISVHGGQGDYEGIMNMQVTSFNLTTLEPLELPKRLEGSRRLSEEGYPIVHGSSFVMALEFTDQGPQASAILSYSQSGDPQSPHFIDQTRLFEQKQWRPVLFTEADIAADTHRDYVVTGN